MLVFHFNFPQRFFKGGWYNLPCMSDLNIEGAYDAILVLSFGGPEGMDDVMPFLRNVTRGRNVPDERLMSVAKHYELFDGVSPINEQNRQLIKILKDELKFREINLPVFWGNRNWKPFLLDTLIEMSDAKVKKALAFVTSAYSSYSSCRQYLEDIERAQIEFKEKFPERDVPQIDKIRPFFNHPGFIQANEERLKECLFQFANRNLVHVAFVAHSLPVDMAEKCTYESELNEVASILAERLQIKSWKVVFQSRSGPPSQKWLEPDILDHIREVEAEGYLELVIAPIGFVSDHMEVKFDLDIEAANLCQELEIKMLRAKTAGLHPHFIFMICDLIGERLNGEPAEKEGSFPISPDVCKATCCPRGTPNPLPSGRPG